MIIICIGAIIKSGKNVNDPNVSYKGKPKSRSSAGKGNVDALFWKRIKVLLRHVFTSWTGREARYIYTLTILLIIRTFMSIWLADVNGRVVKAIVNKSFTEFLQRVITNNSTLFLKITFEFISIDCNSIPVCDSKFNSQLGSRLPLEETCPCI